MLAEDIRKLHKSYPEVYDLFIDEDEIKKAALDERDKKQAERKARMQRNLKGKDPKQRSNRQIITAFAPSPSNDPKIP